MGVVVAVLTATAARLIDATPLPAFTDGWPAPPTDAATAAVALLASAAVIALMFGAVAALSGGAGGRRWSR
jgi:hypothetical protein